MCDDGPSGVDESATGVEEDEIEDTTAAESMSSLAAAQKLVGAAAGAESPSPGCDGSVRVRVEGAQHLPPQP